MRNINCLIVCGSFVAIPYAPVRAGAFTAARSVPPASFLNYHVDTVPQLAFEVTYDHVVQARLSRHFHLPAPPCALTSGKTWPSGGWRRPSAPVSTASTRADANTTS